MTQQEFVRTFSYNLLSSLPEGSRLSVKPANTKEEKMTALLEGEDARLHRKIEQLIGHEAGCWGSKAFWDHTPTDSLTGPDLIVRKFIEQVVRTSKKHQWVAQAKKQWKDLSEGNERPLTM